MGRHITAVVRGEAAHVLTDAGEGDIVASDPEQIAALWRALEADRSRLVPSGSGREWVRHNADYADLSVQYDQHLRATVREYSRVCGQGVLPRLGRVLRAVTRGVAGAGSRESPFTARTAHGGAAQGRPAAEADSGTPDTDHASRRQGVADASRGGVERMAS